MFEEEVIRQILTTAKRRLRVLVKEAIAGEAKPNRQGTLTTNKGAQARHQS